MESLEFEELLVAAMIVKGDHIDTRDIVGKLPVEAFANHHLRAMYRAIVRLLDQVEPIDIFTVKHGVPAETSDLVLEVARRSSSASNIKVWAKKVRQCWMVRQAKEKLNSALESLSGINTHNINDVLTEVSGELSTIQFETNDRLPRRIGDMMEDYMDVLEQRTKGEESGLYLKTGILPMDEKYGGFDRTDLIILAGRPGMGKTELGIMIANSIGRSKGRGLFVSMEMSEMQIVERHVADRSGLAVGALRNPNDMIDEQFTRLTVASSQLQDEDNYVLDGAFSVDEIIAHAERMNQDNGLSFLAIDYLQLIKKPKAERNDLAIAYITGRLKQFALRNKVPVILLSQLNRGLESRIDKRPNLGDLRESGSIEQDADVVIFPYRDEVYDEHSKFKGIAEIIVEKYRSGQPGTFYMGWRNGHFLPIDQQEAAARYAQNEDEAKPKSNWRGQKAS
ncbi:replicative DNA helicase [Rosenbergiella metrosideri]|uniref:replicative DNA helicase n=1 Tax=Rosenbergiella metrosideri TaxID=2921185 RepID=UPI001F4F28E3|nr:replicative DNA helicase [Rosenbergiella metrosideri]